MGPGVLLERLPQASASVNIRMPGGAPYRGGFSRPHAAQRPQATAAPWAAVLWTVRRAACGAAVLRKGAQVARVPDGEVEGRMVGFRNECRSDG